MIDNIEIGKRIKSAREQAGITQEELGNNLSLNKSTIQRYETGQVIKIKIPVLHAIAKQLHVNPEWLALTSDNMEPPTQKFPPNLLLLPKMKKVPLLGTIACGEPILAVENIADYVKMPETVDANFALRCKGNSMINARIFDGDLVYIKEQSDVENGEIAAVLIGDEATLKRVYKYPQKNMIVLKPENPTYDDYIYIGKELNNIRIMGKAVAFTSKLSAIKQFHKEKLDIKNVISKAVYQKYAKVVEKTLKQDLIFPSDEIVKYFLLRPEIKTGNRITAQMIEKHREITKLTMQKIFGVTINTMSDQNNDIEKTDESSNDNALNVGSFSIENTVNSIQSLLKDIIPDCTFIQEDIEDYLRLHVYTTDNRKIGVVKISKSDSIIKFHKIGNQTPYMLQSIDDIKKYI